MMIEPSIDKLLAKTNGNKYVLCTVVAKRAKEIENVRRLELADQDKKAISLASKKWLKEKLSQAHFNGRLFLRFYDKRDCPFEDNLFFF